MHSGIDTEGRNRQRPKGPEREQGRVEEDDMTKNESLASSESSSSSRRSSGESWRLRKTEEGAGTSEQGSGGQRMGEMMTDRGQGEGEGKGMKVRD